NVGGRKVNPVEIEAVLREVPGVRQVVVFGAPDRHRGQIVCACLVAARGVTREALLMACAPRLAQFKLPRRLEFVERIPVSPLGCARRNGPDGRSTSAPNRPARSLSGPNVRSPWIATISPRLRARRRSSPFQADSPAGTTRTPARRRASSSNGAPPESSGRRT